MKEFLKKLLLFIILFILFLYKDLFYLLPLKMLNINYKSLSYKQETLLSVIASCVLMIIIIIIYRKYLKEKIIDYKKNINKYLDLGMKYWFVGICGMAFFNILISLFSPVHEANNEVLVQELLRKVPVLTFISATFIAPFIEEMLFRKSFGDLFKNKKIMVIASGLFFGILHVIFSLQTPWDLLYIIPYGILGSSFAFILYKEDNIFIPITYHMLHNGMLTLVSILLTVIK